MTQLEIWELDTITNNYGTHILFYISAAKLLGYHHLSTQCYDDHSSNLQEQFVQLVQEELEQYLNYLSTIQVTSSTFTRYFYWPLAIIHEVSNLTRASHLIQEKLELPLVDPAGKKAYEWIAKGFERRFKTTNEIVEDRTICVIPKIDYLYSNQIT